MKVQEENQEFGEQFSKLSRILDTTFSVEMWRDCCLDKIDYLNSSKQFMLSLTTFSLWTRFTLSFDMMYVYILLTNDAYYNLIV